VLIYRCQASDPLAAHRDDHLATICDVSHISAEVIVKLAHTHLIFENLMWRHEFEYKHHNQQRIDQPHTVGPLKPSGLPEIDQTTSERSIL
jgi:hypothetical protein